MSEPADDRTTNARPVLGSFIGMAGMAVVLYVILASGLVAPLWAVLGMTLVWLGSLMVAGRWFRKHPWRVAVLPVVVLAVWICAVSAGAAFLGWNA